jgi:hypothetical protein
MKKGLRLVDGKPSVAALIKRAAGLLAEAKNLADVVEARDAAALTLEFAALAREYRLQQGDAGQAHADAWVLLQRATRRLGEMTSKLPHGKAGRPKTTAEVIGTDHGQISKSARLREIGISKMEARRAEAVAALPPKEFESRLEVGEKKIIARATGGGISSASAAAEYDGDSYGTPAKYVEPGRRVMGGIDFDPASNARAANVIRAKRYCTKEDSGLLVPWVADSIWLNPPYSKGLIEAFVKKFCDELALEHFDTAIVLVNSSTETDWYQSLLGACDAICLPDHRIAFELDGVAIDQNRYAQTFFYVGDAIDAFEREYSQFGKILFPRAA